MEDLLEKLRTKPVPKPFETIPLFFKQAQDNLGTTDVDTERQPLTIVDERGSYETLNRQNIIQQILQHRNAIRSLPFEPVSIRPDPTLVETEEIEGTEKVEGTEEVEGTEAIEGTEKVEGTKEIEGTEEEDLLKEDEKFHIVEGEIEEMEADIYETPAARIHKGRPQKDIAEPDEEILQTLEDRLPTQEPFKIRLSKYYLNNRKIVLEKLAKLFEPRKQEYIDASQEVSCEKQQKADKIELLTHQKIVRDYLNLVTPYRGLLLYFGLGSGKSCSSIAIAEGMKSAKEVVLLTPASLKSNFFTELKKCGDPLIKVNQYWEFFHTEGQPDLARTLSAVLSLDQKWIHKNKGAWLMNIHQKPNFADLSQKQQEQIQEQLDEMISAKYISINYNANNVRKKIEPYTLGGTVNPFDNKVIIIDEAHNFVSKIVHKLQYHSKTKQLPKKTTDDIAYLLYTYLMSAINARVVLLSGTPIINTPNEIAVLFNILRGYIQQWEIPISPPGQKIVSKADVANLLSQTDETNVFDYVDVRANRTVVITRNPFGFVNVRSSKHPAKQQTVAKKAVTVKRASPPPQKVPVKKTRKSRPTAAAAAAAVAVVPVETAEPRDDQTDVTTDYYYEDAHKGGGKAGEYTYRGVEWSDAGNISDQEFLQQVQQAFFKAGWNPDPLRNVKRTLFTALPDNSEDFNEKFVDMQTLNMKNKTIFQKRILGLTSYYKSEQENLLPRLIRSTIGNPKEADYFVQRIPMSDHQFGLYAEIRKEEAKQEKSKKQAAAKGENDLFSSTYRIYSRAVCNFAFPEGMVRPKPSKKTTGGVGSPIQLMEEQPPIEEEQQVIEEEKEENEKVVEKEQQSVEEEEPQVAVVQNRRKTVNPIPPQQQQPVEMEEIEPELNDMEDREYAEKISQTLQVLQENRSEHLSRKGLKINSPKFLAILNHIQNPEHLGKHLVYSQFRHLEGIAILKMVLETNGMAEFKIYKKTSTPIPGGEDQPEVSGQTEWGITALPPEDEDKPKFILYTGTETTEEKEVLLNIYNGNWNLLPKSLVDALSAIPDGNNNIYGKVVKVMMITQSGAEGINLKNTRYVHIVEPYWNMVRCSQVVGRARRICSHMDLPKELQTVQVFLYMSVFSKEQKERNRSGQGNKELELRDVSKREKDAHGFLSFTTDQTLFENAQMKDEINQKFLQAVKETSIDCSVYNEEDASQCFTFANPTPDQIAFHPDIRLDENEIAEKIKIQKKMVRFRNKYALEPDYQDHEENTLYDLDAYKRGKLEAVGTLRRVEDQYEIVLNP